MVPRRCQSLWGRIIEQRLKSLHRYANSTHSGIEQQWCFWARTLGDGDLEIGVCKTYKLYIIGSAMTVRTRSCHLDIPQRTLRRVTEILCHFLKLKKARCSSHAGWGRVPWAPPEPIFRKESNYMRLKASKRSPLCVPSLLFNFADSLFPNV